MSYEVHDVNGYLGDGPTISGRAQLHRFFERQDPAKYPAMQQLLIDGVTNQPKRLSTEARALAKTAADPNVKITLVSLAKLAAKADEIVVLAA